MDYPFFIRQIGSITPQLRDDLISKLSGHKDYHRSPLFEPGYGVWNPTNLPLGELRGRLLSELSSWFAPETAKMMVFSVLAPNATIGEHSDIEADESLDKDGCGTTFYSCYAHHMVHIPLVTNPQVEYWHRRSRKLPMERQPDMEPGGVYLYNNYVNHSVVNKGSSARVHLLIKIHDPKHEVKRKMLQNFGIPLKSYYESL